MGWVRVAVVERLWGSRKRNIKKVSDIGHHSWPIILPVDNLKVFFIHTGHHHIKSVILESISGDIGVLYINGDKGLGDVGGADVEPGEHFWGCKAYVEV